MSKTQYLQRLGQSWYVRVKVPAALQSQVGNTHIRRALGTRDLDEAARRKWCALAQIRAHLDALAGPPAKPAREVRLLSLPGAPAASHAVGASTESHSMPIAIDCNLSAVGDLQSMAKADELVAAPCLDSLLDKWLGGSDFVKTTKYQRRQAYGELRAFLGADLPPGAVTSALAAEYVDEQLRPGPGSISTKRRKLSGLSAFWEWLGSRRIVPHGYNPWRGLGLGRGAERTSPRKRPHTMDELVRLFSGNPTFPALREVMVLGPSPDHGTLFAHSRIDPLGRRRRVRAHRQEQDTRRPAHVGGLPSDPGGGAPGPLPQLCALRCVLRVT